MNKDIIKYAWWMYVAVLVLFFGVYYFFMNEQYFRTTMVMNAFVLPLIFAVGAFVSVNTYKKLKGRMSFKEAFNRAFLPMFMAGFLSIGSIFLFINFGDAEVKQVLNRQYIESFKNSLEEEYAKAKSMVKPNTEEAKDLEKKYQEGKLRIAKKVEAKEDMFSAYYFSLVFAGYCLFFIILSVFFGSFFRSKSEY